MGSDYITFPSAHNLTDGESVVYTTSTTAIGGLTSGTTYFIRNGPIAGGVSFSLYTTEADALACLLYTSPSPRDAQLSRMPSSA